MGQLIGMEFRKIIEKRVVLIGVALVVLLNCMMYDGWMRYWEVMREDGTYADGQEAILLDQEIARQYEGPLTDETIQQILKDYELPEGFNGTDYPVGYIERNNMYASVWMFRDEQGQYNGKTMEETYFAKPEELRAGYNRSWSSLLYYMSYLLALGIGFLLLVAISPVFAEEYTRGMDALILTSRFGKTKCAWAKIIAALLFGLIVTGLCVAGNIGIMLMKTGTAGWNTSLQFNSYGNFMNVPYGIGFGEACIYAVCIWIASAILITGMSLAVSSVCRSNFVALIVLALVYAVPMFLTAQSESGNIMLSLFPMQQITLASPFAVHKLGGRIPFQVIIAGYNLIMCVVCVWIAKRSFSRHQVSE